MSNERVVGAVRRMFGDVGQVAERLQAGAVADEAESAVQGEPPDAIVAALRDERRRVVDDGIAGLTKLADGDDDLDDDQLLGLEAIVVLEGRPAILIRDGDFLPPPPEWTRLSGCRREVREVIARTGRVEVDGHLDLDWLGTASLVGATTLMTNRHVAREFCWRDGPRWRFRPYMTTRIDFVRELGTTRSLEFEITEALGIHEDYDLALLRVAPTSPDGRALPEPLPVAASEPADLYGRDVYLVGYPAEDGRRNEPEPIRRLFMDIFNVKRLQPGQAVDYSTQYSAVQHDCSTLGGNSGSPLVDLDTHRVVGLHFGGRYGVGNYAVPLWTLTDDPLLRTGDLNFQ
jgi:hypothetical protein